jgi:hypothetical protein|tara:strand:+ start:670 stop:969 length:300 start_codon:yes stop_codon:yes gene_type:complete
MGMQSFRSPPLPLPPERYDKRYLDQLIKILGTYFSQLDSQNPLNVEGVVLTDLTDSPVGLPPFSLYRDGRNVKILLPQDTGVLGVLGTSNLGSVTITIS